jgi:hypothetical protein
MKHLDDDLAKLVEQYHTYATARVRFLAELLQDRSCRDPLAEFSEVIVSRLLNAQLAPSPVQKGYDMTKPDGRRVQVKYLSNPGAGWINWHTGQFMGCDDYALTKFIVLHQFGEQMANY